LPKKEQKDSNGNIMIAGSGTGFLLIRIINAGLMPSIFAVATTKRRWQQMSAKGLT